MTRLGDFFSQRQEPGAAGLPVMAVTMNDGLVLRDQIDRRLESALRPEQHLLVKKGDIAYNMMRMWQGACGLAIADGIVSPAYVVLTPKPCIDSRFAYHWFKSDRMIYLFCAYSHGLTQDRLRLYFDGFAEIPATPPLLEQQLRIVSVLDVWDQLIDRTEQLINAKRQRLTLIRKFIFCDLSEGETELGELAAIKAGVPAPQSPNSFSTKGSRFVRVSDLAAFDGEKSDEPEYLTARASYGLPIFEAGTIVFAKSGVSAMLGRVVRLPEPGHLVSHLASVAAYKKGYQAFLYHWLIEHPPSSLVQGDGFPSIRLSEIARLRVPVISEARAASIGMALDTLEVEITHHLSILACLRKQKRSLMQKLFSGEVHLDLRFDLPSTIKASVSMGGAV